MLECNRLRGRKNYNQIDEDEDQFKNTWINNVSSYGITINKGDIIQLDTSCINTQGTVQDTIEILGEENENGYMDNKVNFDFSYYINHSGFNTIPLPFHLFQTYLTYGTKDYTDGDLVLNRGIGEPDFSNYSSNQNVTYNDQRQMPSQFVIVSGSINSGGGGVIQSAEYTSTQTAGWKIKAIQVVSGVLVNYQLIDAPFNQPKGKYNIIFDTGIQPPSTAMNIEFYTPDIEKASTKKLLLPDGSRYYPAAQNWSGCALIPDGNPVDSGNTNPSQLQPVYETRKKEVQIEIPAGLNTPSNLGEIITSQLQRPENIEGKLDDFVDLTAYKNPTIQTNSTIVSNCNFNDKTSIYSANNLTGIRQKFYSNIALKNPQKWEGLQWSRQLRYFGGSPNDDLNTGTGLTAGRGDFGNLSVGNLGLNACITRTFTTTNNLVVINKGDLILTNVRATETNIKNIAAGFRKTEQYYGNRNIEFSSNSTQYLDALAVSMDIGLYVDEVSAATLSSDNEGIVEQQRKRFMTGIEAAAKSPTDPIYLPVDFGFATEGNCRGTQPPYFEDSETTNDGQQLSHILVKSRYTDTYNGQELLDHLKSVTTSGLMRVGSDWTLQQMLYGVNYVELNKIAQAQNLAIVPIYLDNTEPEFDSGPYIAFVSHVITNKDQNIVYDKNLNTGWSIDSRNMPYGIPIGLDTSFIRNDAVAMINNNFSAEENSDGNPNLTITQFNAAQTFSDTPIDGGSTYLENYILISYINALGFPESEKFGIQTPIPRVPSSVVVNDINITFRSTTKPVYKLVLNFGEFEHPLTVTNLQTTSKNGMDVNSFTPYVSLGAYDIQYKFDAALSRFTLSDMNTPTRTGNGQPYENQDLRQYLGLISTAPEQQVINYSLSNASFSYNVFIPPDLPPTRTIATSVILSNNLVQSKKSLIDSQTGVALNSLGLFNSDNILSYQKYSDPLTISLTNTLLGKMGYEMSQYFPPIGNIQTKFNDFPTFKNTINSYKSFVEKFTRPLTTSAVFGGGEFQSLQVSYGGEPLYLIGGGNGSLSRPSVTQGGLTAFNLPTQLDYPYLCVYSSLIQGGTITTYHGGVNSQSKIPNMGIITRYNNAGSFFYGIQSSFAYTATKDFTLTDVQTDIRLPDGGRPRLLPHSSVIYKITKPYSQLMVEPK